MTGDQPHDMVVVGGGPAGYTAGMYAARAGLRTLIVEGSQPGGALATTSMVENFPGWPKGVDGAELMVAMRAQAGEVGVEFVTDDAHAADLTGPVKSVTTSSGTHRGEALVLATGSRWRRLGVAGEERLLGRGVSTCATCDGFFFRNKDVAVIGGGDSALEEALYLSGVAAQVTVVHRRHRLRATSILQERARARSNVRFVWDATVVDVVGNANVESVELLTNGRDTVERLPVDGVFVAIGHVPASELFAGQVDRDADGYVVTQGGTTATNLPGVFACGDLVDHRYRQAVTAAGSGCAASIDAQRWLQERPVPDWPLV